MKILTDIKLAKYTTFHIGGKARYFAEIKSVEDLKKAVNFSKDRKLNIFILGGGSNVLLPDKGINGLVLAISIRELSFSTKGGHTLVSAGAGEKWDDVVAKAVRKGLGGAENLSLIPGTVGGAVYQNIGAYGTELKDVLESAEAFDPKRGIITILSGKDCRFGYRKSIFQTPEYKDRIIIRATLKLFPDSQPKINYPDLIKYFENREPTIGEVRKAVIKIRKLKLDYPTTSRGTVGSFFKNPVITSADFQKLISDHPDIRGRDMGDGLMKLSAGQLIEKAGWRGRQEGDVGVSKKHALVLISRKGAGSKDIIRLSEKIQHSVETNFGITLEPEVRIIG